MRYEDQLYVWLLACWHGMAYWKGRGLLISAPQAVRELNALTDGPQVREDRLRKIVTEFKNTAPPYVSTDPAVHAAHARVVERTELDRLRKRKSRGTAANDTRAPHIPAESADAPIEILRKKPGVLRRRASTKHAYGYVVVNGVPQWNNGTLHLKSVRKARLRAPSLRDITSGSGAHGYGETRFCA